MTKPQLVILDRDGVINKESVHYIKNPDELLPFSSSLQAIARLNQAGIPVVIATNQSGIGRKYYDQTMLDKIHGKLHQCLNDVGAKVEKIYYCPHRPDDACDCRKPKPGMLQQCLFDFKMNAQNCVFVGDSLRDLQAADVLAMPFVLVKTGYGEKTLQQLAKESRYSYQLAENLSDYVEQLLS